MRLGQQTKDELIDYSIRTGALTLEVVENLQSIEDEGDLLRFYSRNMARLSN